MSKTINICWNGFLKKGVEAYPNEICAFLFSENIYSEEEVWHVYQVKNISDEPKGNWVPDKKEMKKVKDDARKKGYVKLGNIHTHPYPEDEVYDEDVMKKDVIVPSDKDLSYARRFGDVVRGIVCVGKGAVYDVLFHDMFGNKINVLVVEK